MGLLTKKALGALNKYIPKEKTGYGTGSIISNRLNRELSKLAEKELNNAETKLMGKASKELTKIGVNLGDLLTDDALRDPKGALTRVARNGIELELAKANIPQELINPEIIKDPKKVLSGYALNQIGNELEKHNIPRELLNPEVIKNPGPFLKDYATDKLNSKLAKYDIPKELVSDLLSGKIKTQKDILLHLKEPITSRINSELNEKLSKVSIGKTNLADIVGTVSNNLNESIATSDLILYATNKDVLGTNNKIANSSMESDSPTVTVAAKTIQDNTPAKESILQYPLGKDSKQCCYCVITAFEYQYDPNDILGNKRALDNEIAPKVKNLYEIRLPMPASLASTFSANWSDYTSVWSKILRSGSINLTEGMSIDISDMIGKMVDMYQDNPAVKDAVNVGKWAALGSFASGNGFSALGDGINESLNYLRVSGGLTINPMTQATYVAANIRNHKFSFNMIPRNKEEQIAISKIIKLLEDSQLAARRNDMGGILLDFPDTFNIRFVAPDGSPINGILEVPDSVITSINVTRANGLQAFKVSKDFFPISYNLEINFKEMQNLVRQDLKYLRQSTEQFKAFHSGGKIPADWDPNNAMKDIKPFDIGTVASGSSESSDSSNSSNTTVPNAEISATSPGSGNAPVSRISYPENASRIAEINKRNQYDNIIVKVSNETGIPANWIKSIMYQESNMNPNAKSPVGAQGLMQTMPLTRQDLRQRGLSQKAKEYGSKDPFNPENSIYQGAFVAQRMIKDLKHYKLIDGEFDWNNQRHVQLLTATYNQGVGNTKKMVSKGKISVDSENAKYWPNVMSGLNNNLK